MRSLSVKDICNELSIINVAKTYVKVKETIVSILKVNNYYDMRTSL